MKREEEDLAILPEKIRHRWHLISEHGDVSPLCASKPRKINLERESWTNRDEAVTCPRCLAAMRKRASEP